jgi:excisionase family DNA binding protein
MDKLYTVEEGAKLLSIHPDTLRIWLRNGKVKGVKLGRGWRILETELEALTKENPNSSRI